MLVVPYKVKVAVIGSRDFNDYELLKNTLNNYKSKISLIVSGGAKGADSLAERWAIENKIKTLIFYPNWNLYGVSAGFIRNEEIIKSCDCVIAFWDGISKGTKHSLSLCEENKYNKPSKVIRF